MRTLQIISDTEGNPDFSRVVGDYAELLSKFGVQSRTTAIESLIDRGRDFKNTMDCGTAAEGKKDLGGWYNVVHLHGFSRSSVKIAAAFAKSISSPLICSPYGGLMTRSREFSKASGPVRRWPLANIRLRHVAGIHVLGTMELERSTALRSIKRPIVVSPMPLAEAALETGLDERVAESLSPQIPTRGPWLLAEIAARAETDLICIAEAFAAFAEGRRHAQLLLRCLGLPNAIAVISRAPSVRRHIKNIHLIEPQGVRELMAFYRRADLAICMRNRGMECFAIPRSLACGTPVLLPNYDPMVTEILRAGVGIASGMTSWELTEAMFVATAKEFTCQRRATISREWASGTLHPTVVIPAFVKFYENVLTNHSTG